MHRPSQAERLAHTIRNALTLFAAVAVAALLAPSDGRAAEDIIDPNAGESLYAFNEISEPGEDFAGDSDWDEDAEWLDEDFDLESEYADLGTADPLEKVNRAVFAFNEQIDRFGLTPITDVYQAILPGFLRTGIANAFANLDGPVRITNSLLQGRPKTSGLALARFLTNSTLGLGGLFEAGERVHLPKQEADFGMTLARWGTPQGPYMMMPFLGPMTVRNGVGTGVDMMIQPVSWVIGPLPGIIVGAGKDFSRREQHSTEIMSLRDASLDFYAALRSAFLQDRAALMANHSDDSIDKTLSTRTEAIDGALLEARCLDHPRTRREMAKPSLRRGARARCRAAGEGA